MRTRLETGRREGQRLSYCQPTPCKILKARSLPLDPRSDAVAVRRYHVHLARPHPDAAPALRRLFGGFECHHSYDCCGCPHYHAIVHQQSPRRFSVTVRTFLNF